MDLGWHVMAKGVAVLVAQGVRELGSESGVRTQKVWRTRRRRRTLRRTPPRADPEERKGGGGGVKEKWFGSRVLICCFIKQSSLLGYPSTWRQKTETLWTEISFHLENFSRGAPLTRPGWFRPWDAKPGAPRLGVCGKLLLGWQYSGPVRRERGYRVYVHWVHGVGWGIGDLCAANRFESLICRHGPHVSDSIIEDSCVKN